jgi:hypothetical protein
MAVVKPIVLYSGQLSQILAGDTLDGVAATQDDIPLTNSQGISMPPGSPVYISGASSIQLSRADASATAECVGFTTATIANATSGNVRKDGTLTLLTTQWDTITGQSGGLTPGARYFLSAATAGRMVVTTPPTSGFVTRLGTAISTTDFEIEMQPPIRLA